MKLYLILYLLLECTSLESPKYCVTCKQFKTHFPSSKDYGKCPLFPKIKVKKVQEIDYKYCFRKCNCELYFRDSLFSLFN